MIFVSILYYTLFYERSIYTKDPIPLKKNSAFGNFLGLPTEIFVIDSFLIVTDSKPQEEYKFLNVFHLMVNFYFLL